MISGSGLAATESGEFYKQITYEFDIFSFAWPELNPVGVCYKFNSESDDLGPLPSRSRIWSISIKRTVKNLMILAPCLAGAGSGQFLIKVYLRI